jgi:hypothetical protein
VSAAPAAPVALGVSAVPAAPEAQGALVVRAAPVALAALVVRDVQAVQEAGAEREGPAGSPAANGRLAAARGPHARNVRVGPSAIWGAAIRQGSSGSAARRVVLLRSDHSAAEVVAGVAEAVVADVGVADAVGGVRS